MENSEDTENNRSCAGFGSSLSDTPSVTDLCRRARTARGHRSGDSPHEHCRTRSAEPSDTQRLQAQPRDRIGCIRTASNPHFSAVCPSYSQRETPERALSAGPGAALQHSAALRPLRLWGRLRVTAQHPACG